MIGVEGCIQVAITPGDTVRPSGLMCDASGLTVFAIYGKEEPGPSCDWRVGA